MKTIKEHYCNCPNCKDSISLKERKKIIDKIYYDNNIKGVKEVHICPCGGKYIHTPSSRIQHCKTKKHQKYKLSFKMKENQSNIKT